MGQGYQEEALRNLRAKIIIFLFFLDEIWKPVGAACVCRVTFPPSLYLFTLCACVAPGAALRVILFAKAVCAGVMKLLGH